MVEIECSYGWNMKGGSVRSKQGTFSGLIMHIFIESVVFLGSFIVISRVRHHVFWIREVSIQPR
jgi:hypothetical protein